MSTSQAKEEGEEDEILAELAKKQTELKSVVSWPTGCAVSLTLLAVHTHSYLPPPLLPSSPPLPPSPLPPLAVPCH